MGEEVDIVNQFLEKMQRWSIKGSLVKIESNAPKLIVLTFEQNAIHNFLAEDLEKIAKEHGYDLQYVVNAKKKRILTVVYRLYAPLR
jgi:hypothetical protein